MENPFVLLVLFHGSRSLSFCRQRINGPPFRLLEFLQAQLFYFGFFALLPQALGLSQDLIDLTQTSIRSFDEEV